MSETNERSNVILRQEEADEALGIPYNYFGDRYRYDAKLPVGWRQYDTQQDASYFGVWVNLETRQTFSYCEGDRCLVTCPDDDHLRAELQSMAEFYGPPPPAVRVLTKDGRLDVYDERPEVGQPPCRSALAEVLSNL